MRTQKRNRKRKTLRKKGGFWGRLGRMSYRNWTGSESKHHELLQHEKNERIKHKTNTSFSHLNEKLGNMAEFLKKHK